MLYRDGFWIPCGLNSNSLSQQCADSCSVKPLECDERRVLVSFIKAVVPHLRQPCPSPLSPRESQYFPLPSALGTPEPWQQPVRGSRSREGRVWLHSLTGSASVGFFFVRGEQEWRQWDSGRKWSRTGEEAVGTRGDYFWNSPLMGLMACTVKKKVILLPLPNAQTPGLRPKRQFHIAAGPGLMPLGAIYGP